MYYGIRQIAFEAGHYDGLKHKSNVENFKIYDKYSYLHGHNYILQTTVAGTVDPISNMIVDLGDLDIILKDFIVKPFDHQTLNDFFDLSTHENLTVEFWNILRPHIVLLAKIRLYESDKVWSDYIGDLEKMVYMTFCYDFCAAHKTYNCDITNEENLQVFGKCATSHGHNYKLEITFRGALDKTHGVLLHRTIFNEEMEQIIENVDYTNLNKNNLVKNVNPTTENLIEIFWNEIESKLQKKGLFSTGVELFKLKLRETARNYFEYYGPNDKSI